MRQLFPLLLLALLCTPVIGQNSLLTKLEAADAANDSEQAIQLADQLLNQTADPQVQIDALMYKAGHLSYLGNFNSAVESYERLWSLQPDSSTSDYLDHLNNYAYCLEMNEQVDQALISYKKILQLAQKYNHPANYIQSAHNLGLAYELLGATEFAKKYYRKALQEVLNSDEKGTELHVLTLHLLARALEIQHHYNEAEALYTEAYTMAKEVLEKENSNYAVLTNDFGMLYFFQKEYKKAIPFFEQLQEMINDGVIPLLENTTILCNLADCYAHLGQYEKAETLYKEMIKVDLASEGESHYNYPVTISRLGDLYYFQQQYDEARKMHLQAIDLAKKHVPTRYIDHFYILEQAYLFFLNTQDWEAAATTAKLSFDNNGMEAFAANTSLEQLVQQQTFSSMPYALKGLQAYAKATWNQYLSTKEDLYLHTAFQIQKASKSLLHRLKNSFATELDKLEMLKLAQDISDLGLQISQELYQQKKEDQYLEAQFQFLEYNKYILLQDALQEKEAKSMGKAPKAFLEKETNLQQELLIARKQKIQALDSVSKVKAVNRYNNLLQEFDKFKEEIASKYPDYYGHKYKTQIAAFQEVQKKLSDETLLLEYFIGEKVSFVLQLRNNAIQFIQLPVSSDSLQKQVHRMRKMLSDYEYIRQQGESGVKDYAQLAYWFYEQLMAPALQGQQAKQLVIVPDGLLGHLPFESFITTLPKADASFKTLDYLVNDYSIHYQYSANLLTEQVRQAKGTKVLALAASYDKGPSGLSRAPATRSNELRSIRNSLQPLPAARQEVEALEKQLSGAFLYADQANEANFKAQASDFAVLHLAMHGLLNENYPILSSLAFTENGDSTEDNFLQAWEIAQLDLQAELVVLSACETGYGKFRQGEGVMSLARSFMYAGVPSMVVSLWQVNDASTSWIMQNFYTNLTKGMDKAAALRQAKLDYITNVETDLAAHPAFWAPFIQLGDSRPIKLTNNEGVSWIWWAVGAGTLLVLILGIGIRRKNSKQLD